MKNESAIYGGYKKFNVNELKSELVKRGLAVQGKKEELLTDDATFDWLMQYTETIMTSSCQQA